MKLHVERLESRDMPSTLPLGFSETALATGLTAPTAMEFAPDGRLFVAEQGGALRVVKNGSLLPTPFVSLTVDSSGERGLLGVTFDPNFATNQFVYVYYTVPGSPAHNRVSRFTANGDVASAGSETVLMDLDNLSTAANHNGGALHFGSDGKLYIAVGENGTGSNSQTLANRLGKMLRINADGSIPTDNPFFNTATGANRSIWALGLRNPFTFAFQPGTGRMFINDVGQSSWEEIDDGMAGANYGWPVHEGVANDPNYIDPIFAYPHSGSGITGIAIVGGAFYNPTTAMFPAAFTGKYFFADLGANDIFILNPATDTATTLVQNLTTTSPVDLDVGPDGALYYLARGGGGAAGAVGRVAFDGAFATGADAGGTGQVAAYDALSAAEQARFTAYAGFTGGVRVAVGDVTGDGVPDIITAAGPGGGPHVKVFDGVTLNQVRSFFAFDSGFQGGVTVAVGDVDHDGRADIIVGAGAGGGPHVTVFSGATGGQIRSFFAYAPTFTGGVNVAAGDLDGDAFADIVTGAGAGGGPHVREFSGRTGVVLNEFMAYATSFTGGVWVAVGDVAGDSRPDVVTGAGAGGGPHVRVFDGGTSAVDTEFFAYGLSFTGGARVTTADVNGDGRPDIVTAAGPGGGPNVRTWRLNPLALEDSFFAFDPGFTGGVFVG
ncbi:MAG: PQQ-dependent sugar dehydrogenase [Gemmataceae bacterium]